MPGRCAERTWCPGNLREHPAHRRAAGTAGRPGGRRVADSCRIAVHDASTRRPRRLSRPSEIMRYPPPQSLSTRVTSSSSERIQEDRQDGGHALLGKICVRGHRLPVGAPIGSVGVMQRYSGRCGITLRHCRAVHRAGRDRTPGRDRHPRCPRRRWDRTNRSTVGIHTPEIDHSVWAHGMLRAPAAQGGVLLMAEPGTRDRILEATAELYRRQG